MKTLRTVLAALIVSASMSNSIAQKVFTNQENVANNGYDVVSYFTANEAQRGSNEYSTEHSGATYFFVNEKNLESFKEDPGKYLPQFDGYCAFAVAKMNQKVPVDPATFRIDDGKLYLFFNDFWEGKPFNTIVPWLNNEAEMTKLAEGNWKTLKNQ